MQEYAVRMSLRYWSKLAEMTILDVLSAILYRTVGKLLVEAR